MKALLAFAAVLLAAQAQAAVSAVDDEGTTITLQQPARRIASLAPHVTELLFAAGAGDRIVGTVKYSDYPPAARDIPRVGDNRMVDIERLLAAKPDLLVVWRHNASIRQMDQLRALGIPLFYSEPHRLEDVPDSILRLGSLAGTGQQAQNSAAQLRRRLDQLHARYRNRAPVRVFYQVWDKPLYTLNERHIINDAIRSCGGENVFAKLNSVAPTLDAEAVLQENPEAVLSADRQDQAASGIDMWKRYPSMLAVKRGNLFALDADLFNRSGPRIIEGAEQLCEKLDLARKRRGELP